jgi:hypothetical protein
MKLAHDVSAMRFAARNKLCKRDCYSGLPRRKLAQLMKARRAKGSSAIRRLSFISLECSKSVIDHHLVLHATGD